MLKTTFFRCIANCGYVTLSEAVVKSPSIAKAITMAKANSGGVIGGTIIARTTSGMAKAPTQGNSPQKGNSPRTCTKHGAKVDKASVASMRTFRIHRYNSDKDTKPYMEEFQVDLSTCGPMILDALLKIKDTQDSSLSLRRSCREGICGSCAMNIDGKNGLSCLVPIPEGETVTEVRPLPNMYVLRDLVVDMTNFYNQYRSIEPWLKRRSQKGNTETLQSKKDRQKLDGLYECILCACCSTSCPSYWWNPEYYLGPAVLLQAYRWLADSRDEGKGERLEQLNDAMKLFRCHQIKNCSACCPKGLDPAKAIDNIKEMIHEYITEKEQY